VIRAATPVSVLTTSSQTGGHKATQTVEILVAMAMDIMFGDDVTFCG